MSKQKSSLILIVIALSMALLLQTVAADSLGPVDPVMASMSDTLRGPTIADPAPSGAAAVLSVAETLRERKTAAAKPALSLSDSLRDHTARAESGARPSTVMVSTSDQLREPAKTDSYRTPKTQTARCAAYTETRALGHEGGLLSLLGTGGHHDPSLESLVRSENTTLQAVWNGTSSHVVAVRTGCLGNEGGLISASR